MAPDLVNRSTFPASVPMSSGSRASTWRTAHGDEVDLLLEVAPETFVAVECKAAERVSAADLKGVRSLAAEYGPSSVTRARIACRTELGYPIDTAFDARALPLAGPGGLLADLAETPPALAGSAARPA